ncbi:MAG: ECF transporter S component [Treponema sp.]
MEKTLSRNRKLALTGALSALVVVLGLPPMHLGMIPLGPNASITIMHIPVLLAVMLICLYKDKSYKPDISALVSGITVGAVFGIFSLMLAAMMPTGALDPLFVNPGVSILPRMLLGVVAWILWYLLNLIPHMPKTVSAVIVGFVSTLAHTFLVIGALYIFTAAKNLEAMGGKGYIALMAILLPNALLEAASAAVVCAAVIGSVTVASGKKSKLSQESGK